MSKAEGRLMDLKLDAMILRRKLDLEYPASLERIESALVSVSHALESLAEGLIELERNRR